MMQKSPFVKDKWGNGQKRDLAFFDNRIYCDAASGCKASLHVPQSGTLGLKKTLLPDRQKSLFVRETGNKVRKQG